MFGFDFNGNGNVDLFESMLTIGMLEEMEAEEELLEIDLECDPDDDEDYPPKKKRGFFG